MRKNRFIYFMASLLISTTSFAISPIKVINNTNNNLHFFSTFCSDKMCDLLNEKTLHPKTSGDNSITIMAPLGNKQFDISTMTEISVDVPNKTIASRTAPCHVPHTAGVVIIDDFGTDQLFCHYAD